MEVKIDKTFQKDVRKINNPEINQKIAEILFHVRQVANFQSIRNLRKIKTHSHHFRIKLGDYRIGIIITGSVVEFIRCLHRKDIYKFFPRK